jgi:hypothetical protein
MKKSSKSETDSERISEVMSLLAKRSVEARKKAWGKKEFKKKMRAWGKLGGRPKKSRKDRKEAR